MTSEKYWYQVSKATLEVKAVTDDDFGYGSCFISDAHDIPRPKSQPVNY